MRFGLAVVIAVIFLAPSPAAAQAPAAPAPAQRDVLGELLVEVRGLRQAMERAATVGARIQLLVARVQLQEQRIAENSRRLASVRDESSQLETQITGMQAQAAQFEKTIGGMPPQQREEMDKMVESFKTQAVMLEKRRGDLAGEESQLLEQISTDQNRWRDVNAQLDEIERALAAPPKK